jgi:hypothetical protein
MAKPEPSNHLRGWSQIANFLGQPVAVAQRWAKSGMPVRRDGRYTAATPDDLRKWLGRESGAKEPVFIGASRDLTQELRRGLEHARRRKKPHRVK